MARYRAEPELARRVLADRRLTARIAREARALKKGAIVRKSPKGPLK